MTQETEPEMKLLSHFSKETHLYLFHKAYNKLTYLLLGEWLKTNMSILQQSEYGYIIFFNSAFLYQERLFIFYTLLLHYCLYYTLLLF